MLASFVYWKSLDGLISLLLCSQTTSKCSAPMMRHARVTASPSLTNRDSRWETIFGGLSPAVVRLVFPEDIAEKKQERGDERSNLFYLNETRNLRLTVNLLLVSTDPTEFVAVHVKTPSSSGKISLIVKVATPFLYFKSIISEDEMALPFLDQVICGSGSPLTVHVRTNWSPSRMVTSFRGLVNSGLHIRESSGGTRKPAVNKLVLKWCLRDNYMLIP